MSNERFNISPTGDKLEIRQGSAPDIFVYQGFQYTAESTDSLIKLVLEKGSPVTSVIAYTESGFKVILDDTVTDRKQDRITYGFKLSQQYTEWYDILKNGKEFDQKEFIKFLQRREPWEITNLDILIANLQQFKYAINISNDYSFSDDTNYTFAIRVGEAEGTVKLPQLLMVNIEILNESGFLQDIEVELEVYKPKSQDEKPTFSLSCPKLQRYLKAATDYEIQKVKNELNGYLIVAGNI